MVDNETLCEIMRVVDVPLCLLNHKGEVLDASRSFLAIFGIPEVHVKGIHISGLEGFDFSEIMEYISGSENIDCLESILHSQATVPDLLPVKSFNVSLSGHGAGESRVFLLKLLPVAFQGDGFCAIDINFHTILDTISDGALVMDGDGCIKTVNPSLEALFGYPRQALIGFNVRLIAPDFCFDLPGNRLSILSGTGSVRIPQNDYEVMGRHRDGRPIPVHISIAELLCEGPCRFIAIIHDLSARRKVEERISLLSRAIEQTPAAIIITDLTAKVEYVNEGFLRLTGCESGEVIGQDLFSLGHQISAIAHNQELRACVQTCSEWCGEIHDIARNGHDYWAIVNFTPIKDAQGKVTRLLGRMQDISQQKRDQMALAESENRFREIAEMVGEWLWEQDAAGRYTYSSAAVMDILGYQPEEIIGKQYCDLLTGEDRVLWADTLTSVERIKLPFHRLVNHYRHKDGHEVYTESTGSPVLDAEGNTIKWRGMDLDITERKRAEDAVRLRERAIEAASVGIAIADASLPNLPNIYVNSALCQITGYSDKELLGRSLKILQGKATDETAREKIRFALDHGLHCEVTLRNYRKDGTGFWNELLLSPVRDEKGTITHYIGIIADISERRRAEDERHELEIARQIQMSLLPKAPLNVDDVSMAGVCVPAAQVGGDYYDFFCHGDNIDVVIADVSGHSVGAALLMAEMRSTLKAEVRRHDVNFSGPARILSDLNEVLYADLNGADLFITMFYLRYNRTNHILTYANAGHNLPLLLRNDACACQQLDAEGLILGVKRDVEFEQKTLNLKPGDSVLLYTDGVVDTENERGEFFGVERLCRAYCHSRTEAPDVVLNTLLNTLHDYRGRGAFMDDISMIALRMNNVTSS
ncbi:MAG: PAS domain S-box protein [Methylococcaceae bacterium]